jgi:HlyD family secretion protein
LIFSGTIEVVEIRLGTEMGGRVEYVSVQEGEQVKVNQSLVELRRLNAGTERVRSPIDGVVLERLVEPGEVVAAGGTLLILGNLNELTLTVYVPEDKYGQIALGQVCWVMVDSFPDEMFVGRVSHIADRAEFTPRNVQTTESRKTTVFAVRLDVEPAGGRLKPGMPADVNCMLK